jgi:integral membrane sensor domain MASE1
MPILRKRARLLLVTLELAPVSNHTLYLLRLVDYLSFVITFFSSCRLPHFYAFLTHTLIPICVQTRSYSP